MRSTFAFAVFALALGWTAPSSAQMCGPGQSGSSGGMSCPMMRPASSQAPAAGQQSQAPSDPKGQGMCGCCQRMAMMGGGGMGGGGMGGMGGGMMQHQPQASPPPASPPAPEKPH